MWLLKETGRLGLLGILERREWPMVWSMLVKACSKGGGGAHHIIDVVCAEIAA